MRSVVFFASFRRIVLFAGVMSLLVTVSLSGCNTIAGAGKDIEATGEAIEETAEKTKQKM